MSNTPNPAVVMQIVEAAQKHAETKKVIQSPQRQLTEYQLAHAALQAAIRSQDLAGVNAARIWLANVQVQERQARLLLLEHVVDKAGRMG